MYEEAEQLVNQLTETERENLEEWARLDSRHSIAAGGIGQTRDEQIKAEKAWDKLSPKTKKVYKKMIDQYHSDLKEALKEASDDTGYDEDEIEPGFALGDYYPLWNYLSAQI